MDGNHTGGMIDLTTSVKKGALSNHQRTQECSVHHNIVMSIPYGLMLGAVYYLLAPLAQPGTALPTTALWLLVGGFLVQLIAYFFIRQKTYIDASTGYAGIIKDSQITLG